MKKTLILFSLLLVTSMCFVTMQNTAHADSQTDILVKIAQNTQTQIKKQNINTNTKHNKNIKLIDTNGNKIYNKLLKSTSISTNSRYSARAADI